MGTFVYHEQLRPDRQRKMNLHDLIEQTYDEYDTRTLQNTSQLLRTTHANDRSVEDTRNQAETKYSEIAEQIRSELPTGDVLVDIVATASREQAISAVELCDRYDTKVDSLVLDIDETLRTVEYAENTIPVDVRACLRAFWEDGTTVMVATGKPLEFVRGVMTQGLGQNVIQSDRFSAVYEAGAGVYTPGAGEQMKSRLYETLSKDVRGTVEAVRRAIKTEMPEELLTEVHLEEKSFNVTILPNTPTGSQEARTVVQDALVELLLTLGEVVTEDTQYSKDVTLAYYGSRDPEIEDVLRDKGIEIDYGEGLPDELSVLDALDVVYYEADAVELLSNGITKRSGVETAFEALDMANNFALVMGDSKTDLPMMEHVVETGSGILAAPEHASDTVLEYVRHHGGFVFERGHGSDTLQKVYAYNQMQSLEK